MSYAKRVKPNWAVALTHPRDRAIAQAERQRRAHERAWCESGDESGGRVCAFANVGGAGVLVQGYDREAEYKQVTRDSNSHAVLTLSKRKPKPVPVKRVRQHWTVAGNRQAGGR